MENQRLFGLIGKKLGHSFSKKYFTGKFEKMGIDARYEPFELASISEFPGLIANQKPFGLTGLNVTIPYKKEVIAYLDELSPEAEAISAVNTIRVEQERLTGHNSDIPGFRQSLLEFLDGAKPAKALILGTGGASRAVGYVLDKMMGGENVLYVSRDPSGERQISYDAIADADIREFPLIVNTTPLGMYPDVGSCPDIPYHSLTGDHFLYDLIYNPEETVFMQKGAQNGARTFNGMRMLILQAERSWEIWNE